MSNPGMSDGWSAVEPHAQTNVFVMLHRLLRGRYLITGALALVLGVVGGLAGFMLKEPQFRSDSIVKIQPQLPKILYEVEQSSAPRMFASFVSGQAQLMQSTRTVEYAMDSDRWIAVRDLAPEMTVDEFRARLSVRTDRRSQELITISFEHEIARVAREANQALVEAYMDLHGSTGALESERTVNVLEDRRRQLQGERDDIDRQIRTIVEANGTDQLGQLMNLKISEIARIAGERRDAETRLRELERLSGEGEDEPAALTVEQAARIDPDIGALVITRTALEAQLSDYLASGMLRGHRQVRQVERGIAQVNEQIDAKMQVLLASLDGEGQDGLVGDALSIEELRAQIAVLGTSMTQAQAEQQALARATLDLRELNAERAQLGADLELVQDRITAIQTEKQAEQLTDVSGRISIADPATTPKSPSSDKRIKLAGVGFVGGFSLPVMGSLALGMLGRRIRYSDDGILEAAHSRVVGVLPDLGNTIQDQELAEASAFAVHQIRSQLQILYRREMEGGTVFAATSPAPGDGKTSMIIALGLSFAESGDRTLLIDLDLIGRGLSLHFNQPAAPSLADAAATGEDLGGMICETGFDGLSILPAGFGDDMRISRLSPIVVRRLVEMFRDRYDTILFDSGPILGSIEAGLLSPAVDGMLMVVGRGQLRPLVKRAVDQITGVGGHVAATVFNRASEAELRQSTSSMSVHFSRQASRQAAEQASGRVARGGPLAHSLYQVRSKTAEGPGTPSTPDATERDAS